jgi:hypothetical protein
MLAAGKSIITLCYYSGEWPGSAVDLVTESRLSSQAGAHVLAWAYKMMQGGQIWLCRSRSSSQALVPISVRWQSAR